MIETLQGGVRPAAVSDTAHGVAKLHRPEGRFGRVLHEPLLHFLVVGVVVFGVYAYFNKVPDAAGSSQRIEIGAADIRQLAIAWLAQGRSMPNRQELQGLVDQQVTQEILYREGLALGLDQNDEIIKRRIVQKMDFLAADVAALQLPGNEELRRWYAQHSARFALPPRLSFRHIYFSPDKRGNATRDDAVATLRTLAERPPASVDVSAVGDPFMLRDNYADTTPDRIEEIFGPNFAAKLFALKPGAWQGPLHSGYGWHLVWIDSLQPGRVPAFEEVAADVKSAWLDDHYQQIRQTALARMRSHYTVVVAPIDSVDLSNLKVPKNRLILGVAD